MAEHQKEPVEPLLEETGEFAWKVLTIPFRVVKSIWDVIWPDEER